MELGDRKRLAGLDALKGLMILCVAVSHSLEIGAITTTPGKQIYLLFFLFHMPVFIFLNGLFVERETLDLRRALGNALNCLALYFLAKVLYYGMFRLLDGAYPAWKMESVWGEQAIPWYMLSLAEWHLIAWLTKRVRIGWLLGLSVVLAIAAGFFPRIGGMLSLSRTLVFLPFFLLGCAMSKETLWAKLRQKRGSVCLLSCCALLAILTAAAFWIWKHPVPFGTLINLAYGNCSYAAAYAASYGPPDAAAALLRCALLRAGLTVFAFACLLLFLGAIPANAPKRTGALYHKMAFLGENTLPVYLFHFPLLLLAWRRILAPQPSGMRTFAVACIAAAAVTALLARPVLTLCFAKLRRLFQWLTHRLPGAPTETKTTD